MEEGPEPQELMDQVGENIEARTSEHEAHEKESGKHNSKHMRSAITAAVLAVLAALGSLLAGHSANDAILLQSKASDQWSYYQAKSTKGHLYEVNKTLVEAFLQIASGSNENAKHTDKTTDGNSSSTASQAGGRLSALEQLTKKIDDKMKTYEADKKEVEDKAVELEKDSNHAFAAHEMYSFGVACFQIGIVMASVSILVDSAPLYFLSITGGIIGVVLLIVGYVR